LEFIILKASPIGIFDSGYGGLTVFKEIAAKLPQYDYLYLGDNARAPYGTRSFETVYEYTLQAVKWFFEQGCELVILACNTASAKALRTIQQNDLPKLGAKKRVLGVIRPTSEIIGRYTKTNNIGILATNGTVQSESYLIEIEKSFPEVKVYQQACPLWVPLIENNEYETEGADFFYHKNINQLLAHNKKIDTILLACTHYPLIKDKIQQFSSPNITILSQGEIVANSLGNYLDRHPEMEKRLSKHSHQFFYTTDDAKGFDAQATKFFGQAIQSKQVHLG
jgi:glutamate racemase